MKLPRLLFLNRCYWPDAEATGQLLTELCEDLAEAYDVTVIAGQPNQNPENLPFRRLGLERRRGVAIRRVWNTRLPKANLLGRAVNLLSFFIFAAIAALRQPRPNVVVVETDPPFLCLLGLLVKRWRGAKLVVYLQDIYPDVAVSLGKLRDGPLTRRFRRLLIATYCHADQVIVLSRDMGDLLIERGVPAERIVCLPNWVDTSLVVPVKSENGFRSRHGLVDRFVVMYSGNLGLCQRLDDVLAAADLLRERTDVEFLLIGGGASRARLEHAARDLRLSNVRFLPYQPKGELSESLSAADVHLVPLDPRVVSCLMPSKLYGILASGTAVIAVAPENCELAEIIRREEVGMVLEPGRPDELAAQIVWAADHRADLARMGARGRLLAERQYDRRTATGRFAALVAEVLDRPLADAAVASGGNNSPAEPTEFLSPERVR